MNWDQIQGQWKELKGKVMEEWADLTEDDLQEAKGNREQLEGKIQERYGKTKEEAKAEVDKFMSKF